MGTVTIHRTRYLEDDVVDGEITKGATDSVVLEDVTAVEAARLISDAGLTFGATGAHWAANPDGSYISNYRTGERVAETAHLSDFHPRVEAAIVERVG